MSYESDVPAIIATEVDDDARLAFLPKLFGHRYLISEHQAYALAEFYSNNYHGGFWRFFTLSCGGGFMCPDSDDKFQVIVRSNCYRGKMSAEAFGIFITMMNLNRQVWIAHEQDADDKTGIINLLNVHAEKLRAYAAQHPEAAQILRAVD